MADAASDGEPKPFVPRLVMVQNSSVGGFFNPGPGPHSDAKKSTDGEDKGGDMRKDEKPTTKASFLQNT